ncbi:MAG: Mur ligase family protein [Caldisericia bacterium]
MKKLIDLLKGVDYKKIFGDENHLVNSLAIKLEEIKDDTLFFIIKGQSFDGMKNFNDAYLKGVRVFISDRKIESPLNSTYVIVDDVRETLYKISKNFYNDPSKNLNVFGITGSSGKTSVIYLLRNIFPDSGSIGSEGIYILNNKVFEPEGTLTTPESHIINYYLKESEVKKVKNFFIEVSSFAIKGKRVYGIDFKGGIFLNFSITHHLKIHKNIWDYLNSKLKLKELTNGPFLINRDDPYSDFFKKDSSNYYFSYKDKANFYVENYSKKDNFYNFKLNLLGKTFMIDLYEKSDIYPILPTLSLSYLFNLDIKEVIKKINDIYKKPEGRWVIINKDPLIIVDKANTPLSIKFLTEKIKDFKLNRKIVLFSFFEEEDIRETLLITKLLVKNFDYIFVSQDDSKEKTPFECNKNFIYFLKKFNVKYSFVEDRKKCIKRAIESVKKGDGLFILGRGDEKNMRVKDKLVPFNDIEVTKEILSNLKKHDSLTLEENL